MKRRVTGSNKLLDDDALERQLAAEFSVPSKDEDEDDDDDDDLGDDDDEDDDDLGDDDDDDDDDFLYDGPDEEEVVRSRRMVDNYASSDVIEVYDGDGNLVGTYTDEEFEALRRRK